MNDRDQLAYELHEVSDHGRDGSAFGSMLCDCDRRAERVLNSGWLRNRDAQKWDEGYEDGATQHVGLDIETDIKPATWNPYRRTHTQQGAENT